MSKDRLFIFDCDGVLVDSEPLAAISYVKVYAKHGMTISPDIIAECIGMKQADILVRIETETGHAYPQNYIDDIWTVTKSVFADELEPVPGIADFLLDLEAPRCVASSSSLERILHSLTLTDLLKFFGDSIFSSSMVKNGRPAPDLFLYAADKKGYSPDRCIVIEDSPFGVQAAIAANMTVLGFIGGGHTHPAHEGQLRDAGASLVFGSWAEIREWKVAQGF